MLKHWQLVLAAFWACFAVAIFFREDLGLRGYSANHWMFAQALAAMLALWNLVRWQSQRARSKEALPPNLRSDPPPYEYNPELDFQKMERDKE